jgi:hypothetical protein
MGWVSWRREWIWHPPEVLAGAVRVADASGTYPSTLSSSWFEARMNIHSSPCSLSLSETVKTTHNHIPKSKSGSRMVLFCFFFSSSYTSPLVFLYMCSKHLRPESCHDWILQQTDFARGMKEKSTKRITWVRNSMCCCWRLLRRSAIGSLDPDPRLLANLGWRKWEKTWSKTWYNIKEGYRFSSSLILNLTTENWIPRLATIIQKEGAGTPMQLAHSEGVKGGEEPWKSIPTIPPLPAKLWLGHSVHTLQFWVLTDVSHFPVIVVANEIVKGTDLSMPLKYNIG